jgi:hypothetical protein
MRILTINESLSHFLVGNGIKKVRKERNEAYDKKRKKMRIQT